jgi:hypothetical protein
LLNPTQQRTHGEYRSSSVLSFHIFPRPIEKWIVEAYT